MKKVTPEKVEHFCDRCKKPIDHTNTNCTGKLEFVGRDFQGYAVTGQSFELEFCPTCTDVIRNAINGEKK